MRLNLSNLYSTLSPFRDSSLRIFSIVLRRNAMIIFRVSFTLKRQSTNQWFIHLLFHLWSARIASLLDMLIYLMILTWMLRDTNVYVVMTIPRSTFSLKLLISFSEFCYQKTNPFRIALFARRLESVMLRRGVLVEVNLWLKSQRLFRTFNRRFQVGLKSFQVSVFRETFSYFSPI